MFRAVEFDALVVRTAEKPAAPNCDRRRESRGDRGEHPAARPRDPRARSPEWNNEQPDLLKSTPPDGAGCREAPQYHGRIGDRKDVPISPIMRIAPGPSRAAR